MEIYCIHGQSTILLQKKIIRVAIVANDYIYHCKKGEGIKKAEEAPQPFLLIYKYEKMNIIILREERDQDGYVLRTALLRMAEIIVATALTAFMQAILR